MALGHVPLEFELRDVGQGARLAPDGNGFVLAAAAVAMTSCVKCDDLLAVGVVMDMNDGVTIRGHVLPPDFCSAKTPAAKA